MSQSKTSLWGRPELYLGLIILFFFFVAPYVSVELMRNYRIAIPGYDFLSMDHLPQPAWSGNPDSHIEVPAAWWLFLSIGAGCILSLIMVLARQLLLSRILFGTLMALAIACIVIIPNGKVIEDAQRETSLTPEDEVMESFTYEYEERFLTDQLVEMKAGVGLWFTAFLALMGILSEQVIRFFGGGPRKTVVVYRTATPAQRPVQNLPPEEDPFWDTDGKG